MAEAEAEAVEEAVVAEVVAEVVVAEVAVVEAVAPEAEVAVARRDPNRRRSGADPASRLPGCIRTG